MPCLHAPLTDEVTKTLFHESILRVSLRHLECLPRFALLGVTLTLAGRFLAAQHGVQQLAGVAESEVTIKGRQGYAV